MDFLERTRFVLATVPGHGVARRAWRGPQALRETQNRGLQRALSVAYDQTEFFKKKWDEHGVHPRDVTSIDDLSKLPITTKRDLAEHFEACIPSSLHRKTAFLVGTSGTTGQPLRIYKDYQITIHIVRDPKKAEPDDSLADVIHVIARTFQAKFGPEVLLGVRETPEITSTRPGLPPPLVLSAIGSRQAGSNLPQTQPT